MDLHIKERVARGVAALDTHRPDWWQHINLDRLDICSYCNCVMSQLAVTLSGGGWYAWETILPGSDSVDMAMTHGFLAMMNPMRGMSVWNTHC